MKRSKKFAGGYISLDTGSEGPKHDPYSYDEFTISRTGGVTATLHMGLVQWLKINDKEVLFKPEYDPRYLSRRRELGGDIKDRVWVYLDEDDGWLWNAREPALGRQLRRHSPGRYTHDMEYRRVYRPSSEDPMCFFYLTTEEEALVACFEAICGIDLPAFQRAIHHDLPCCKKPRPKLVAGYPGETLTICDNCGNWVNYSFSEAAII